jgi:hypothetical protein
MAIQKYKPVYEEGSIKIQRAPFTQLCNKVLQTCTNLEAIAVWAYLQSQSDNWELNPTQLRKHFKVGKEKIYSILTYMINTKLLVRHVHYGEMHKHISTTYTVLDGMDYLDPVMVVEGCVQSKTPLPENPDPENRDPENQDYKKERDLEKKEEDLNNISATDVTHENEPCAFNTFWDIYPIKKNKIRSKKIWERKKLNKIAVLICNDVSNRQVNDSSWSDEQYIPHPSTYLQNERWNDSITNQAKEKPSKHKSGDALSRVINKHLNRGNVYDHGTGNTIDPLR